MHIAHRSSQHRRQDTHALPGEDLTVTAHARMLTQPSDTHTHARVGALAHTLDLSAGSSAARSLVVFALHRRREAGRYVIS